MTDPDLTRHIESMVTGLLPAGTEYNAALTVAWHHRDLDPDLRREAITETLQALGLTPEIIHRSRRDLVDR